MERFGSSRTTAQAAWEELLFLLAKEVAHTHDGLDLLFAEPGKKITSDRFRMNRPCRIELSYPSFGNDNEYNSRFGLTALDQFLLLHARQVMR